MKKILLIAFIYTSLFTITTYAQENTPPRKQPLSSEQLQQRRQLQEQKADSAMADREVLRMKEQFSLTPQQEATLYKVGVSINHNRREVIKKYWRTEAFQEQIAEVDKKRDSLYQSIVGEANYKKYKGALHSSDLQKQQVMQQRATADSLNRKAQHP